MKLLLDLGNTRLKWALSDADGTIGRVTALAWDTAQFETHLASVLAALPVIETAWLATVAAPSRERQVRQALAAAGIAVQAVQPAAQVCGVHLAYADPARLGVDRMLALVAAQAAGQSPCVVASAGTALTLDALTDGGVHLGGLIVAGPALMQQALRGAAARVQPLHEGRPDWFARNTEDALAGGAWLAAAALTERFCEQFALQTGRTAALLLTGGDAAALAEVLGRSATLWPDAVLRGLAQYAQSQAGGAAA